MQDYEMKFSRLVRFWKPIFISKKQVVNKINFEFSDLKFKTLFDKSDSGEKFFVKNRVLFYFFPQNNKSFAFCAFWRNRILICFLNNRILK